MIRLRRSGGTCQCHGDSVTELRLTVTDSDMRCRALVWAGMIIGLPPSLTYYYGSPVLCHCQCHGAATPSHSEFRRVTRSLVTEYPAGSDRQAEAYYDIKHAQRPSGLRPPAGARRGMMVLPSRAGHGQARRRQAQ
jgi:hypothetical protein